MDFNISFGLAFLAGLASFLSPCVLSLVPAYVGYLGGRSLAAENVSDHKIPQRMLTFAHGLAFVFGFSLVFVSMGFTASAIGSLLYDLQEYIAKIGGIIVVIFGVHMTGLVRIPFLDYELKPQSQTGKGQGFLSSILMGIFFSAGWTPCTGPTLGMILTMAMSGGSVLDGVKLLSAYSAGMAIPFLIAAVGIGWVTIILRRYTKVMHYIEIVMGVILIIVGIMLFLGTYEQIARLFPGFFINTGL